MAAGAGRPVPYVSTLPRCLLLGKERLKEYQSIFQGTLEQEAVHHAHLKHFNHLWSGNKLALGGFIFVLLFFKLPQSSLYRPDTSEVP